MGMTMPRLPSGIYFTLRTQSTANEKHYVPEYPTFPVTHQSAEYKPLHASAEYSGGATVAQIQRRSLPQRPQPQLCLPLLSVSISMQVDCTIAKTTVVQTFTNNGDVSIPEASYSFPLYDGATVTGFRCEVGDDKVLEGKVKPRAEAKREFQRAVKKQEAAALGEEMTPDVFQTTIGNVKPRTTVKIEITYVEELLTDLDGDGMVVTIPTSVAPRYGTPPAGYTTNLAVNETGLSLVVNVVSPSPMKSIVCRSGHGISVEYGKMDHVAETTSFEALAELQSQADSGLDSKRATACLSISQTSMDRDIVLIIPFPDEVFPKSRALLAPPGGSDHAAMMVTVRPSELFSDLQESMDEFEGEILFLADRSGSMSGSNIEGLKDALLVFLKSLPAKCKFNIYSFGDYASGLWSHSLPYNESTMQQALDHISTFQADFGGTEVHEALKTAVRDRRSPDVPSTQIVLLTDGEIWQPEQTLEFVRMTTADSDSQVRFFGLGIGNQVNHQLIKGIGFFGGGFGEAVDIDAHGKWAEAVIRMLKGAMMPTSWSYSIAFGNEWEKKRLDVDDFFSEVSENKLSNGLNQIAGAVNPSFVQAPSTIPCLHHFGQQSVYFLLDTTSYKTPDHVLITAYSRHGATKTVTLSVTKSATNNAAIQHLAAKAAVRDLENQGPSEALPSKKIVKNAEKLCQTYSISSKWASFVAVSHLQQSVEYEDVEVSIYKAPLTELDLLTQAGASHAGANLGNYPEPPKLPGLDYAYSSGQTSGGQVRPTTPPRVHHQFMCQTIGEPINRNVRMAKGDLSDYTASEASETLEEPSNGAQVGEGWQQSDDFRQACSVGTVCKSVSGYSRSVPYHEQNCTTRIYEQNCQYSSLAYDEQSSTTGEPSTDDSSCTTEVHRARLIGFNEPIEDQFTISWQDIVRGQRADGLFYLNKTLGGYMDRHFCHGTRHALKRSLMESVKREVADGGEDNETIELLVDTVMALAYIRSHFYSQRALWDLLVPKAEGKVISLLNPGEWGRPSGLSVMADSAVAHAHYGRCSQGDDEGSGGERSSGSGHCGVCESQGEGRMLSAKPNDELEKCSVSGCDVNTSEWSVFWAHAVEEGHIDSSSDSDHGSAEAAISPKTPINERVQPIDLVQWLAWLAADVIGEMSFSRRLGFLDTMSDVWDFFKIVDSFISYASSVAVMPTMHKFLFGNPIMPYIIKAPSLIITDVTKEEVQKRREKAYETRADIMAGS